MIYKFGSKLVLLAAFAAFFLLSAAFTVEVSASSSDINYVIFRDGHTQRRFETTARTVGEFLEEMGIELHPLDELNRTLSRRIEPHLHIELQRAFYIYTTINGEVVPVKVAPSTTVDQILYEAAYEIHGDLVLQDREPYGELRRGETLDIYVHQTRFETEVEVFPYQQVIIEVPYLEYGVEVLYQAGVSGEVRREIEVFYVNGEEYSRTVIDEFYSSALDEIIHLGMWKPEPVPEPEPLEFVLGKVIDTSDPRFTYLRRVEMTAVAYTRYFSCTGRHPGDPLFGITASGLPVEHGIAAVDRSVIPLGTRLYVEGYGFALAADVGSGIRGYKIDLFMYTLAEARQWGRRTVTVFILD